MAPTRDLTPQSLDAEPKAVVGVDVGGSGLRAARPESVSSPATDVLDKDASRDEVVGKIVTAVSAVARSPRALAIAIPSFVDATGAVMHCPNLPALQGVRLGDVLAAQFSLPSVRVVPDVAAAVTGEYAFGAGRGTRRFLCVAVGTGANAAAIVDGQLVDTAFGCLGDAGHVNVETDGPPCTCGGRGCLEAITSGWALARDGAEAGLGDGRQVTLSAEGGDEAAIALLARAGRALGRAMASWTCMLWPERIAVAGGVAAAGELLLAPARDELRRVGTPQAAGGLDVVMAELGHTATLRGVIELAQRPASAGVG